MRATCLLILAALSLQGATVRELVDTTRSALKAGRSDAEVARAVASTQLTERLDSSVTEILQSEGAGPAAIDALERIQELSRTLPPATPFSLFTAPPMPGEQDQRDILENARVAALAYSATLPDFICTQTVKRYEGKKIAETWKPRDTLTISVAYSDKGERYKLNAINGKPTDKALNKVGGFRSNGEFGSILKRIFGLQAKAGFTWERWSRLRGRMTQVYSYKILQENSTYSLRFSFLLRNFEGKTGMRGLVYIDPKTSQVMRFTAEADGLPADWPILATPAIIDYDFAEVAGATYLLPKRVDSRVFMKNGQRRNLTEFSEYRKFAGEAVVSFETEAN